MPACCWPHHLGNFPVDYLVAVGQHNTALGPIEASFSRHLLFDPGVMDEAILEAMSKAIRVHGVRRGWRYDLCLCSNENAASRLRLGYQPIGIRVDREPRSTVEIYAFALDSRTNADSTPREADPPVESGGSVS